MLTFFHFCIKSLRMQKFIYFLSITVLFTSCDLFNKSTDKKSTKKESTQKEDVVEKQPEPVEEEIKVIERPNYNPSATILTDLINTTLWVAFDWENQQLNGTAEITASPYFYATDSLILDAKAMEIHSVKLMDKDLNYTYNDGKFLRIGLDREYSRDEEYIVRIKYTAKPEEKAQGGSSAISSDKGLYFINPEGKDPNQMPQIWTQGETEASSVWFPTIDRPNQKMSQEIYMTVDEKYATLSNGKLVSSTKNDDGTRTDHWKQEIPHVPYLAAMAVGEFAVIEDFYERPDGTKMPVNYYVEPEWEEHAQAIFGETPEMIKHFSELFGVEFPWDKYHSVIVREYVSGAMENTGAVVFGDQVYKTTRELIDMNDHSIIAHELAHHWFGNIVTCESWANLPLNESFANYAQYLWDEHYYGVDQADYYAEKEAEGYYQMAEQTGHHDMIWFDYDEKEDMFDAHSYNKGGRILHMLRNYVGDDAFFESLKLYLTRHQYEPVEIHELRLAFEDITGEDLNWFFNQWFFAKRHPILKIDMEQNESEVALTVEQVQDLTKAPLYKLPIHVAIYDDNGKTTYEIEVNKNINEFTFPVKGELKNIIFDEQRMLLGSVKFKKPREFYLHQFYNAPRYKDREQGLIFGSRIREEEGHQLILDALEDDFWYIRKLGVEKLKKIKRKKPNEVFDALVNIIKTDENSRVRASSVKFIGSEFFEGELKEKAREIINYSIEEDSSYMVLGRGMAALLNGNKNDQDRVLNMADSLKHENSSILRARIAQIFANFGGKEHLVYFKESIDKGYISGYDLIGAVGNFTSLYKKQDLATQKEYFGYFEELSEKGNPYISAVLPMNIMGVKRDLEGKISDLNQQIESYKDEGNTAKMERAQIEKEELQEFADKVTELLVRSSR